MGDREAGKRQANGAWLYSKCNGRKAREVLRRGLMGCPWHFSENSPAAAWKMVGAGKRAEVERSGCQSRLGERGLECQCGCGGDDRC